MAGVATAPPNPGVAGAGRNAVLQQQQQNSEEEEGSLRVYLDSCKRHGCRPNTAVLQMLPKEGSIKRLDLSLNFVGRIGLRPILDVISRAPQLQHVCLADNFLDNTAVSEVLSTLDGHKSLRSLDLSRNPISQAAGKLLASFVRNNANLVGVTLDDTLLSPSLKTGIMRKVERNSALTLEQEHELLSRQAAVRRAHILQQARRQQRQAVAVEQAPCDTLIALAKDKDPTQELKGLAAVLECF